MVTLGIAYIEGYDTTKNPSEGIRWLLSAINANDAIKNKSKMSIAQAYKYIGECYWEGLGVLKDKDIARKYFRKSKEYGFDIDEDYL
jgi:TPR repeat protein